MLAGLLLALSASVSRADQPKLGFSGTLVKLRGDYEHLRGFRVDSVTRGSHADKMGLERGDIVIFVGKTMAFTTQEAYLYALRMQPATTEIGLINVRNGKLVWCECRLNHDPGPHESEDTPPGVVMVDFSSEMQDAP